MEEEDKLCLKIHGYVSLSEDDSDFEQTSVELDSRYQLFKPPPFPINPIYHTIIKITEPIHPNRDQQEKKNVSYADILRQISAQNSGQNPPQSVTRTDGKTLSRSQRRILNWKLKSQNGKLMKKVAKSGSEGKMNSTDGKTLSKPQKQKLRKKIVKSGLGDKVNPIDGKTLSKSQKQKLRKKIVKSGLGDKVNPIDRKTLSKTQNQELTQKIAISDSRSKINEDHPNSRLGQVDKSHIWCHTDKIECDNKFSLLGDITTNEETDEENEPANERSNYLYYPNESTDFGSSVSFKNSHFNGELKDYKTAEIKTNIKIVKEIELSSYFDSEIHTSSTSLEIPIQSENAEENKAAKKRRRRRRKTKKRVSEDALITERDTNYLYYPYDSPDFESFMSFKVVYGECLHELEDYKNTDFKTNVKTAKEIELSSHLDSEIHRPDTLQCSLENSNQIENAEENKPGKKRKDCKKKRDLQDALISECDTNYLYYPYDSPDFETFMAFKEMYLNGELKNCNRTEETTNVEIEKKSELTSYLNSETHIPSAFQYFFNNSTQFENVELSNEFIYHQGTGFYEVFIFTQSFLTNLVKLALQQNHIFTKEQLSHLDYVYKALIRIHALYEAFLRTPIFLQFSKDSPKEPTNRMKQNDLVHFGQTICKNMGITFSVEDAYMIVGKFYCSMNLTTEYDLSNLEVKENLQSENFLLVYKNLNFIFDSFIATVLLNVVWIVKQKLHEYQIRQRTLASVSDKRLINHFLKPEDFDAYSRAHSHLSIQNLEMDKFIINCLFLNQNKASLMAAYQSFKQKILMYDCTKVNETNLFQLILEDLTENRRYHYTIYNQRDLEYWQNSQENHQNENESFTPVFEETGSETISNTTFHQSVKNTCTNLLTKIKDYCFSNPKDAVKTLLFYMCLKYYNVINDSYIVVCCENIQRFTNK